MAVARQVCVNTCSANQFWEPAQKGHQMPTAWAAHCGRGIKCPDLGPGADRGPPLRGPPRRDEPPRRDRRWPALQRRGGSGLLFGAELGAGLAAGRVGVEGIQAEVGRAAFPRSARSIAPSLVSAQSETIGVWHA